MQIGGIAARGLLLPVLVSAALRGGAEFDVTASRVLVTYAWASFCEPATLTNWSCEWCADPNFKFMGSLNDTTTLTRGYVGYLQPNRSILLVFRGSVNAVNYLTDFDIAPTSVVYGNSTVKVHAGFHYAWTKMREAALDLIAKAHALCGDCELVATGHSLGAGVAGIAAVDLAHTPLRYAGGMSASALAVRLHTFGMPRTGDPAFASLVAQTLASCIRVVHHHDIVPHLPPRLAKLRDVYHHVPTEVWETEPIGTAETYRICDDSGEDASCSDSVPAIDWRPSDHLNYMGIQDDSCRGT